MSRGRARSLVAPALLLAAAAIAATAAGGDATKRIRVTFIGDSVPQALDYVPVARQQLSHGLDVRLDLRVCRRLATASCGSGGAATPPPSALETVKSAGLLGDVLVIDVGYNEDSRLYRDGMRQVIRAALAKGVDGIVWVTLRETRDIYRSTNAAIRAEAKRWPQVHVADWQGYSSGRPWFGDDGLHLNPAGAEGLAALLRPFVLRAARHAPPAPGNLRP